jgi:hypothetical protein
VIAMPTIYAAEVRQRATRLARIAPEVVRAVAALPVGGAAHCVW